MWPKLVAVLIFGYSLMGRTFAYMGIPPLSLYIGEMALGGFLVLRPRESVGAWTDGLVRWSALSGLSWALFLLFAAGIMQIWHGGLEGYPIVTAARDFAFNYYPLYLFLGIWVGRRNPQMLPRLVRTLAWVHGLYGLAYILVLGRLGWTYPWGLAIYVFGQPGGSALSVLGLVAFERDHRRARIPYILNLITLLALQVRAEWLGLFVAIMVWMVCTGRIRPVVVAGVSVVLLLVVAYATDLEITVGTRGTLSAKEVVGRALAPLATETASKFSESADAAAGTVLWRRRWWDAIWDSVHESPGRALVGHGYGYPLASLEGHIEPFVRTPHSLFYFTLGYTGWSGVAVVAVFHLVLVRLLWRVATSMGEPFGIVYWSLGMVLALFGNFFETPYGAVPFYLLVGLVLGRWLAWGQARAIPPGPPSRHGTTAPSPALATVGTSPGGP